jgi:hypothetical protein
VSSLEDRPRRFVLVRHEDVSGVSGTGVVADGVVFPHHNIAVVCWRGQWPTVNTHVLGVESVESIHGHGGYTRVVWHDEEDSEVRHSA